ncbi:YhbD family protein [Peribacillus alkalitolerans]|uniref:YhbD family protein n=1 Tax=Peribacillus alkalitolerans TaxID=1550385 RepID=UPI0013D68BF3|nr:YhbD family protein [Peribacillus alkalitolerans]
MSEEEISKKELLELTGISYGQLYRWKRKNLIPEDWFIRKSAFTGQETFFPKDKILERIEKIQQMKENVSLDQLADMFSSNLDSLTYHQDDALERNIVSNVAANLFSNLFKSTEWNFLQLLHVFIVDKGLQSGDLHINDAEMVLQVLKQYGEELLTEASTIVVTRKMGVSSCFLLIKQESYLMDIDTKLVWESKIMDRIEQLKMICLEG